MKLRERGRRKKMKKILTLTSLAILMAGCGSTRVVFVDTQGLVETLPIIGDETIVLSDGGIVESVNHRQLLGNSGHYEQMWVRQSSGFSGDLDNDNVISKYITVRTKYVS